MSDVNRHDDSAIDPSNSMELPTPVEVPIPMELPTPVELPIPVALSTPARQISIAFEQFGYTPREIAFLALATVHSGFFVKRQWAKFAGAQDRRASEFLTVLMDRGHIRSLPFGRDTVYHIGSHAIYHSIGRHPRGVEPFAITRKLMALDVVLEFPDRVWHGDEHEKIALFTGQFGLDKALLPVRRYHSRRASQGRILHYFGESFPIGVVTPAHSTSSVVTFVYVSHAERTTSAFQRFVLAYAPLMSRLPAAIVLYVSSGGNWGSAAQAVFARHYPSGTAGGQDAVPARLTAHFESRRRFEHGQIGDLSSDEIEQLRSDLVRFRGARYDRLYHLWQSDNDASSARTPPPTLETYHIPFTYPVGGALEHPALRKRAK